MMSMVQSMFATMMVDEDDGDEEQLRWNHGRIELVVSTLFRSMEEL
jgi:hypothetical protein